MFVAARHPSAPSHTHTQTLLSKAWLPKYAFSGRRVWITGASSGIGEHLAYHLAKRGAVLVLSARRVDKLDLVAAKCRELGAPDVVVQRLDVLAFNDHAAVAAKVVKAVGYVDVLVNNAGTSQRGLAEDTPLQVDKECLELNALGPISVTKAILPHMLARNSGHIVVTSSVAGKLGAPVSSAYSAAKHATNGFFNALRMEVVDRNVDVTLVCPGPVVSDIQRHSFTTEPGKKLGVTTQDDGSARVSTDRCAFLMAAAMYHRLDEVWISKHPVLFFTYMVRRCCCVTVAGRIGVAFPSFALCTTSLL